MNSVAPTVAAADSISSRLASGRPKAMFSRTLPEKRKPSWGTMPSWPRRARWRTVRRSWPSTETVPAGGRRSGRRASRRSTCRRRSRRPAPASARAARAGRRPAAPNHQAADLRSRKLALIITGARELLPRPLRLVVVGEPDALHRDLAADLARVDRAGGVDHVRERCRAGRRSCRAPPSPAGRSCRAGRAAGSVRRRSPGSRRRRRSRRSGSCRRSPGVPP